MERKQFTFYESFARALLRIKKDADRAKAYDAIVSYALYGIEPDLDKLPDSAAIAFDLIQPTLDSAARKSSAGKTGGDAKQTGSKTEANRKQNESKAESNAKQTGNEKEREKEGEKEKEIEKEVENECYNLPPTTGASAAISYFLDRINPAPAGTVVQELLAFERDLGTDVVLHALQIAVNDRKTAWSYIRAILTRYKADGLRDLPAVLESETRHEQDRQNRRPQKGRMEPPKVSAEEQRARDDKAMEQVRQLRAKMNREESP